MTTADVPAPTTTSAADTTQTVQSASSTGLPGVAGARSRRAPRSHRHRSRGASLGLHLALVLASIIAIGPVVVVLFMSFKPNGDVSSYPLRVVSHPTFGNYSRVWHDGFGTWLLNSTVIALFTTVISVFIAASAGYAVSRFRFAGYRGLMWSFLLVQMFPAAILIVPLYNLLNKLHLLDQKPGLILAYCSTAVPFCVWMLKGYFDTIPVEIDEAGRVDGLSPFGTFWRLVLPLAKPGLAVTAFYAFITAWNEFIFAFTFMTKSSHYTLAVGLNNYITEHQQLWSPLAAGSVLVTLPAILVFYLAQRYLVAGLTAGGTKY